MKLAKNQWEHQSFTNSAFSALFLGYKCTQNGWFLSQGKLSFTKGRREVSIGCVFRCVKAVMEKHSGNSNSNPKWRNVKVTVSVKRSGGGLLSNLVEGGVRGIEELVGKTLVLELVSNDLDSSKFFILFLSVFGGFSCMDVIVFLSFFFFFFFFF